MKHCLRLLVAVSALALLAVPAAVSAGDETAPPAATAASDNLPSPKGEKQIALRQAGLEMKVNGTLAANTKVGQVAKGQYVELAREGEDAIWTVLAEFGTQQATHTHGTLGVISHAGTAGPLHNQIPKPDRSKDNTTIWSANFDRQHFLDLLFKEGPGVVSMRQFYIEQSANRYAVNGDVTDWVQVPFNEAAYGSNYCGSIVCSR